jgi:hypothetical protein
MKYEFSIEVNFSEALKPYSGPDVNQKFAGEDDPVWCERCKTNHRRTAGWEIEEQRMINRAAAKIAERIDREVSLAVC